MKNIIVEFHQCNTQFTTPQIQVPQTFNHGDLTKYLNFALEGNSIYNFYISNASFIDTIQNMLETLKLSNEDVLQIDYEIINDNSEADFIFENEEVISCVKVYGDLVYLADYSGCVFTYDTELKKKTVLYNTNEKIKDFYFDEEHFIVLAANEIIDLKNNRSILKEEVDIKSIFYHDRQIIYNRQNDLLWLNIITLEKVELLSNVGSTSKIQKVDDLIYISTYSNFYVYNIKTNDFIKKFDDFGSGTFVIGDPTLVGGTKGKMLINDKEHNYEQINLYVRFVTHLFRDQSKNIVYSDQYRVFMMNRTMDGFIRSIKLADEINGLVICRSHLVVTSKNKLNIYKIDK